MDCKEVFNAGDDGKLLLSVLPNQSKRFIYGLEDEELVQHLGFKSAIVFLFLILFHLETVPRNDVVVLFPSSSALSFPEWMEQRPQSFSPYDTHSSANETHSRSPLTVIVVDAVWRHARRMACRLREILPAVRHVQLTPEQMSVYARKQSQPDRICTVEATALFLYQYGETEHDTDMLVECVKINNLALKQPALKPSKQRKVRTSSAPVRTEEEKGRDTSSSRSLLRHPAWYFGRPYREPKKEFNPSEMIHDGEGSEEGNQREEQGAGGG
jgi:hypothetical protein